MSDPLTTGRKVVSALQLAKREAEAAIEAQKAAKLEEALAAKTPPMTTPQGTGLPLMPRSQGMYTPGIKQEDLPRIPMVDKARAAGEKPKYTERMQDLLDSPTARKKIDKLIAKGEELGMREWYGTEPLRQVAMDIGLTPKQFNDFMAQMASASQRNPVDQQNLMGSYLWHLSQTGQLPEDAFLLTNKLKKGERPAGTAIELPPGYGSLAQSDIFKRGKQIAAGDLEGALPPNAKLGTFYRNLLGNLKPVTVDVNAVRGPIIERGDPRWLTSKVVEKDPVTGKVTGEHFPRKAVESGQMSLKQAKERPGFWEAAPSGSEYAGFEDLWQRGAKRHNMAPAEAQALGWYGSADVTALKTKPELYIDNLERMIRRTAEITGKSPRQVMEEMLRGQGYLKKKDGGEVTDEMRRGGGVRKRDMELRKDEKRKRDTGIAWTDGDDSFADGGAAFQAPDSVPFHVEDRLNALGYTMQPEQQVQAAEAPDLDSMLDAINSHAEQSFGGGGWAKAGKAIAKAAEEAGMARPVTAQKDLTTLEDTYTSLGDKVRERVAEAQKMMEGFDYKYDKGQRVFTKDSAAKNRAPYTILHRTRTGNQVMREDMNDLTSKVLRDETGKVRRTPYEPGYRVRMEHGPEDTWHEFDLPQSAILGDVEMAGGGMAKAAKAIAKASEEANAALKGTQKILPAEKREANLEKFLAESKDKRRFYHGTKGDIKNFFPGHKGTFVSPDPDFAGDWSINSSGHHGPNVMPVRVQVKNPFDYDNREHMKAIREAAKKRFPGNKDIQYELDAIAGVDDSGGMTNNWASIEHPDIQKLIRQLGHDAYYTSERDSKNLGIFDPKKIKSETGNRGTYDVNSPDINEAHGGLVQHFDGGGLAIDQSDLGSEEPSKARLMAEILARMAKAQGKEEIESLKKPRAMTDLANRGIVASLAGLPVDLINMGLEGVDAARDLASGKRVGNRLASERPVLGSEHLRDLMREYGMTTDEERPMMETLLSLPSPAGAMQGAAKLPKALPKAARAGESALNTLAAAARRPMTPATITVEAVAPDLAKYKPRQWQETATRRLTGEGAPVSMETMGGRRTTKRAGQGVYENEAGQLETNPLVAVDVPRAGDLSKNKALRADIATAGQELGQEAMAAHRFVPMATNQIKDASAMLIKGNGPLTDEQVKLLGERLPGMIVAHNPRLGGVVIAPFDYQKGRIPNEFLDAQSVAKAVLGKDAKFQYGKAEQGRDLMYMPRSDYATEGAREPSAASKAMRERLKRAEQRLFRELEQSQAAPRQAREAQSTTLD